MLYCYANGFASLRILGGRYWYSKERSCDQRNSNLACLSAKKRCMASEIILVLTNIVIIVLGLLSVLLDVTNIMLQSYHFLICQ